MIKLESNKLNTIKTQMIKCLSDLYGREEASSIFYILLEHVLGLRKIDLALEPNREVDKQTLEVFNKAFEDLLSNMPIQHITGYTFFMDLKFHVDKNVLIPRPETEELVNWILTDFEQERGEVINLLDVGTGSGCIPVSLKYNRPDWNVSAVDLSEKALAVAKINAKDNKADVNFSKVDILSNVQREELNEFEVIVSNPPYIKECEKALMLRNVLDYEPDLALFVKDHDPLLFYREIGLFAIEHLKNGGKLYYEINEAHGEETRALLADMGFTNVLIKKDIFGKDRMVKAVKP